VAVVGVVVLVAAAVVLVAVARQEIGSGAQMKYRGIQRFFRHIISTPWSVGNHFSKTAMHNIEMAIKQSEKTHMGEIRFVVEANLHPLEIMAGKTPRKRALELFSQLGIWDTEHNTGVLLYLLLADRDIEIVADRGIHQHVGNAGWGVICKEIEKQFRHGAFEAGTLFGINQITQRLQQHFSSDGCVGKNELPDKPLVL
jgi:uncharacterized membrane protein